MWYILVLVYTVRIGKRFDIAVLIKRQLASWKGTKNQGNSILGGHSSVADWEQGGGQGETVLPFVFQQLWHVGCCSSHSGSLFINQVTLSVIINADRVAQPTAQPVFICCGELNKS